MFDPGIQIYNAHKAVLLLKEKAGQRGSFLPACVSDMEKEDQWVHHCFQDGKIPILFPYHGIAYREMELP